ncbi:unnamed protein product, partial [marine sediment metagenome]
MTFFSAGCAAAPIARPATPAEAASVTPIVRTDGMLISIIIAVSNKGRIQA